MTDSAVIRLRSRGQPAYTDAAALNDIHAMLTTTGGTDAGMFGDIAALLARTGRPMIRARHIEASVTESLIGWPVAHVDAEATAVAVRQDPTGPGLLIEITTRSHDEGDDLTITLDGRCLYHSCPTV